MLAVDRIPYGSASASKTLAQDRGRALEERSNAVAGHTVTSSYHLAPEW